MLNYVYSSCVATMGEDIEKYGFSKIAPSESFIIIVEERKYDY